MSTVTIVSNGHGEDVIGATLATSLRALAPALAVRAFPLVDEGAPYREEAVERLGSCRVLPSGGFTMHSLEYFLADVRAGLVGLTFAQLGQLARLRSDALVVVGDIYAQLLAAVARAPLRAVLQPLVSAYHVDGAAAPRLNRYFMERISYPERALMRHLASVVYARDEATAAWLRAHGVRQALALGNPMVDRAAGRPLEGLSFATTIALLPGTRAHTPRALELMAAAVARLPAVTGLVAWSGGAIPPLAGWDVEREAPPVAGRVRALRHGASRLWLFEGRFGDVISSARAALGTAGTGNEQAAARGVPVVSFPVEPHYTPAYLANQKRLLGEALIVTEPEPRLIAAALWNLLVDGSARQRAMLAGRRRMGGPGGSEAIARDLLRRLAGSGDHASTATAGGEGAAG